MRTHPAFRSLRVLFAVILLTSFAALAQPKSAAAPKKTAARAAALRPISSPKMAVVDAIVEDEITSGHIPGAVVVVGHNGKVMFRKAYGLRSLEPAREPMTLDTIFDMASLTKPMATGMAMMRLLETGAVRLDEPASRYIPELAGDGKDQITIRQLLTHYSGLRPDLDLKTPWEGYDEAMRRIWEEKLSFAPGSRFVYSDINFEILGELVARVSKMPLNQYAEAHIFKPLGMRSTRFLPPKEWLPRIAPTQYVDEVLNTPVGQALPTETSHTVLRGVVHDPTARRMGGVAGHAGLFSCAEDVSKFAQAMLDRKSAIAPLSIEKMTTPQTPANQTSLRGLGWDIDTSFSTNRGSLLPVGSFGHTGFTGTSLWMDPTTNTYVIILSNVVHPHGKGSAVALRSRIATAVAAQLELTPSQQEKLRLASITGYNELMSGYRRLAARNGAVLTGIDVLQQDFAKYVDASGDKVLNVGVVTNLSGFDLQGKRTIDILANAPGLKLAAIFSPEHGVTGTLDTTDIGNTVDHATGVQVYSVYGDTPEKRHPPLDVVRQLDIIFYDIQDVGARFYTYETTLAYFVEAAGATGKRLIVLDRPNPVTGAFVQGPVSESKHLNFVDYFTEPIRHGMTMGELAQMFNGERKLNAPLTVVPMQGWQRGDWFDSTSLAWVNPSPNLRDMVATTLYTGVCIVEGTNVSVGRGTDTPFQLVGAPWIKPRALAAYLNGRNIPGVRFVPVAFTPAQGAKLGGQQLGGVHILLTDRLVLDAPQMGIELAVALRKLYPNDFNMDRMVHLVGNDAVVNAIREAQDPRRIAAGYQADLQSFLEIRKKYLIYK